MARSKEPRVYLQLSLTPQQAERINEVTFSLGFGRRTEMILEAVDKLRNTSVFAAGQPITMQNYAGSVLTSEWRPPKYKVEKTDLEKEVGKVQAAFKKGRAK